MRYVHVGWETTAQLNCNCESSYPVVHMHIYQDHDNDDITRDSSSDRFTYFILIS
jgi:hypothetical protein